MRSGGDEHGGNAGTPGGEPQPAELWISGAGSATGGHAGPPPSPTTGSGPGRPGRGRWIALAAGFVVLVAVIAVQHVAGGHPAASTATSSSAAATPSRPSTTMPSPPSTSPPSTSPPSTPAASSGLPESTAGSLQRDESESQDVVGTTVYSQAFPPGAGPSDGVAAEPGAAVTTGTAPVTNTITTSPRLLPATEKWELVGYGPEGVARYQPATGLLVTTPVPPLDSNGPLSFVVTTSATIIRPMDSVPGFQVTDGKAAVQLTGLLARTPAVLPGPDPRHLWVSAPGDNSTVLVLVDARGKRSGPSITLPQMMGMSVPFTLAPDGAGDVLLSGVGGTYDVRPGGAHLVTHGAVLAVGPTGYLVYDCTDTARCGSYLVDRKTGHRHRLAGFTPPADSWVSQGVISPDGRYAALIEQGDSRSTVELVDLSSGHAEATQLVAAGTSGIFGTFTLAFTPDSRYLLIAGTDGVTPVDTGTGRLLTPLPVPPLTAIAVRPGS